LSGLRIYGIARTRAFRALWMANELGLDYEHLPIEIGAAGARSPEFLAINPNGRLPFIVDNGFVLFESLAITLYLAKKHSNRKLYPGTLEDEASAWQWSRHRGRSRRQHLVVARRPPAAGRT
jgi:glutathione S-transferase